MINGTCDDMIINGISIEDWERFYQSIRDSLGLIAMEECGELIQAISKTHRYTIADFDKYRAGLIEEMADVRICMRLLMRAFAISDVDVWNEIKTKMERNLERLG